MTLRPLAAEALGTLLLVTAVIGSAQMATTLTRDGGVLLLANAIATGCALFTLITILAPLSGAHFNPAVTLVMALRRKVGPGMTLAYVAAQLAGGVAGTLLTHAMFDLPLLQTSTQIRTGSAQFLAEIVATFGLILTILSPRATPALIAAYITAAYWFTASTSFANPVMDLARALTDTPAGIRPADAPSFLGAQLIGAALAASLASWLFTPDRQPDRRP